jgi:hypothetical protein
MKDLSQLDINRSTTIMIVGAPGAGKTTLALQFPRPYIFDADNKLRGPLRHITSLGIDPKTIKYDHGTVDENGTPIKPLQRYQHMVKCLTAAAKDETIDTIIIDSGTAIQEYIKNDIFRQRVPNVKSNTPLINEANLERAQLTEPEWGIYGRYWNSLVTEMQTLGKIVIFTMHFENRSLNEGAITEVALAVQGQTRYKLAGLFSDVINPFTKTEGFGENMKVKRYLRTIPVNENDQRGLQSALGLKPIEELTDATTKAIIDQFKPAEK